MNDIWKSGLCTITFGLAGCASTSPSSVTPDVPITTADIGLHGPDANDNGVRDYIEDYIENTYVNGDAATQADKRKVYLGFAREVQFRIDNADNPEALSQSVKRIVPFIRCMSLIDMSRDAETDVVRRDVYALSANTPERDTALRRADKNLGGGVIRLHTSDLKDTCPSYVARGGTFPG